jgi:hypothetical protein
MDEREDPDGPRVEKMSSVITRHNTINNNDTSQTIAIANERASLLTASQSEEE